MIDLVYKTTGEKFTNREVKEFLGERPRRKLTFKPRYHPAGIAAGAFSNLDRDLVMNPHLYLEGAAGSPSPFDSSMSVPHHHNFN